MTNTDNGQISVFSIVRDAVNGLGQLFRKQHKEVLTFMRQPTPVKITATVQSNATGVIGGGLTNPSPVVLYQCPISTEAWVNRIAVTAQGYTPANPLSGGQAQIWVSGSTAGEPLFWLPLGGIVAPVQITEGRLSAIHLNPGEQMFISGDGLPVSTNFRFDFQIVYVQGVSDYTPAIPGEVDILP